MYTHTFKEVLIVIVYIMLQRLTLNAYTTTLPRERERERERRERRKKERDRERERQRERERKCILLFEVLSCVHCYTILTLLRFCFISLFFIVNDTFFTKVLKDHCLTHGISYSKQTNVTLAIFNL